MFYMNHERWQAIHDWAGLLVRRWMIQHHDPNETTVLDVGAGWGKYRELLPEYAKMDAVEVWRPTVDDEDLRVRYRNVFATDVYELVRSPGWLESYYDVVILGDVLEHLTRERAQTTLSRVRERCDDVIVVLPYLYAQDEEDGNPYQVHRQDDLTPELVAAEYPELRLVAVETRDWRPFKGLYVRRGEREA